MEKKYYTINQEKKQITVDSSVKVTQQDKDEIQMYIMAGYIIRHKSEKRSKSVAKRSTNISDEEIKEALKEDKENLEIYLKIKGGKGKGTGFFAAKSFYINLIKEKENQEKKEDQENKEEQEKKEDQEKKKKEQEQKQNP